MDSEKPENNKDSNPIEKAEKGQPLNVFTEEDKKELQKIFKQLKNEKGLGLKNRKQNIEVINNNLEEFLNGYLLMGFDAASDEPIVVWNAKSEKTNLSLEKFLEKVFIQFQSGMEMDEGPLENLDDIDDIE